MAYNVQAFVAAVLDIAEKRPAYRTGGTGKDGTCDCVGLIMGAMYALGHKRYDLHSSNYFARYQMEDLRPINSGGKPSSATASGPGAEGSVCPVGTWAKPKATRSGAAKPRLQAEAQQARLSNRVEGPLGESERNERTWVIERAPKGRATSTELEYRYGMIVYKAREDRGDLNARYKPGGRYYTGDMLDYYHVGVVTSVIPLHITHCTSGGGANGIKTDYAMGAWRYGGELTGVDYDAQTGGGNAMEVLYRATVTAPSGSTVNLRESPRANGRLIERVPIGTQADVWEDAQGWAHIQTDSGQVGYMMSQYLARQEGTETPETGAQTGGDVVSLQLPRAVAKALFDALEPEFANG